MDNFTQKAEFLSLASSFEHSPVPFSLLNCDFEFMHTNDAFKKRCPDPSFVKFSPNVYEGEGRQTVLNYLKTEKTYTLHLSLLGGESIPIILNAIFDNQNGKLIGSFALILETQAIKPLPDGDNDSVKVFCKEFNDKISLIFSAIYGIASQHDFNPSLQTGEYINAINQACYELFRSADNVSRLSRIIDNNDFACFNCVNLVDFLNILVSSIVRLDNKNGVPISFTHKEKLIPVKIDLMRMEFALCNIILNSIKYTRAGNSISIDVKVVGNHAVISVSDSGLGIPKSVLPNVGQAHFSYSHGGKFENSLGMGLYISKKYISANGGFFSITSEDGVGTTVTVSLPILSDQESSKISLNSPPDFNPSEKFSQTSIQLCEVCYHPTF